MSPSDEERIDEIAAEYMAALRGGQDVPIEALVCEHPDLAKELRELLPMMAAVEDAKAGQDASDPEVPERIGDYRVVRVIGTGGMGRVFEVRDPEDQRLALKVLHAHLLRKRDYVVRILREAQAGMRVKHPNVVRTLKTGVYEHEIGFAPFVAMEYVEGQNLDELVEEVGPVPERLARHIGESVAAGLEAIHAAGILHRDVKPANVIITPDETIKLMDLGVARLDDEAYRVSQTGEFVGSLLYAAPEQLKGEEATLRTDSFGLGLILFELLTGRPLFTHAPGKRFDFRAMLEQAPDVRTLRADVSPFLAALVASLLDVDAERRPTADHARTIFAEGERSSWWQKRHATLDLAAADVLRVERVAPLRGREQELETLDAAYEQARSGEGLGLVIEGEAGIGKTRLLREWLDRRAADAAPPRMWIVAHDTTRHRADAFLRGLRAMLGRKKLAALFDKLQPGAPDLVAHARESLEEQVVAHSPRLDALATLYVRAARLLAEERPLIVVVDDAHALRSLERETADAIAAACFDVPILVLVARRPSEKPAPEKLGRDAPKRMELGVLDTAACREVLDDVLQSTGGRLGSAAAIAERVDGNPYFLLEFLRNETSQDSTPATLQPQIPDSLREMVRVRLRRLSAEDRELLEAGACIGDMFDPLLATELCGVPRIQGLKQLGRLQRRAGPIVAEGRDYRFRHRLAHDVLYDDIHPSMREAYHLHIAKRIRDKAHVVDICRHLLLGGDREGAAQLAPEALRYHIERRDLVEAAALAQPFLKAPTGAHVRAWAAFAVGSRMAPTHPYDEVKEVLRLAIDAADHVGDAYVSARARLVLGEAALEAGDVRGAYLLQVEAEPIARQADDLSALAGAIGDQGRSLGALGEVEKANEVARRSLEISESIGDRYQSARRSLNLGVKRMRKGELDAALPLIERAIEHARASGNRYTETSALKSKSGVLGAWGRAREALEVAHEAIAVSRELDDRREHGLALSQLAFCQTAVGRWDAALPNFEQALQIIDAFGMAESRVHTLANLIIASIDGGFLRAATEQSVRLLELVSNTDNKRARSSVCRALAPLMLTTGSADRALEYAESGRWMVQELGNRFQECGLLAVRARTLDALEQWDEAPEAYDEALFAHVAVGLTSERVRLDQLGVWIELGRMEPARQRVKQILSALEDSGMDGLIAVARLWDAVLHDGDHMAARLAFEQAQSLVPYDMRIATHARVGWLGDEEHVAAAKRLLEAWLEQMEPEVAEQARKLPRYARILAT